MTGPGPKKRKLGTRPDETNLNELGTYPIKGRTVPSMQELAHKGIHRTRTVEDGAFEAIAMLGLEDICWLECGVLVQ